MTIFQDIYNRIPPYDSKDNYIIQYFVRNIHGKLNIKEKWNVYRSYMTNDFIDHDTKDIITRLYGKYINVLLYIYKWIHIYRLRKSKIYNTTDLLGTNLDEFKKDDIICLFENNTKYLFTFHDLKCLFYHAMIVNIDNTMFITQNHPRNPHTNIRFSESSLFKIRMFFSKYNIFQIPRVIHSYFDHYYDLDMVYEDNRYYLNMICIKKFVNKMEEKRKVLKVLSIIYLFTGNRLNESTCRSYLSFKDKLDSQVIKELSIHKTLSTLLLRHGNKILMNYYYYIFFENSINKYKSILLKENIVKYIPIEKYFESSNYTFQLRQKHIIDKKHLDYIARLLVNSFDNTTREQRRNMAKIRSYIRNELDWTPIENSFIIQEREDTNTTSDEDELSTTI